MNRASLSPWALPDQAANHEVFENLSQHCWAWAHPYTQELPEKLTSIMPLSEETRQQLADVCGSESVFSKQSK